MEVNIFIEFALRVLQKGPDGDADSTFCPYQFPWPSLLMPNLVPPLVLMITFGVLTGFASPVQMMMIGVSEVFFYAFKKAFNNKGLSRLGLCWRRRRGRMTIVRTICSVYLPWFASFFVRQIRSTHHSVHPFRRCGPVSTCLVPRHLQGLGGGPVQY